MRVTNRMITSTVLKNLNSNLKRLHKMQDQMSSGKSVSKPSDDPVYVARIMRLQSMVRQQENYQANIKDAQGFVDNSESSIGTISDIMNRARELAIYGANGAITASDRQAILSEVDELIHETLEVANSSYAGRFIFGGYQTEQPPFRREGDTIIYDGDQGSLDWEVAQGVTMSVNLTGDELFGVIGDALIENGVFDALLSLKKGLDEDDQEVLGGVTLKKIDDAADHILSKRAILGAKSNRLSISHDRAFERNINLTELLSNLEDVDWAEAVMYFKTSENVYRAALATGAHIMQPTLLDYLR
ncbi:MAG: flagellar hook-associated protein FlgL [Clostridia bacterium]|nr:flagellar hook-associated protein FlgL [Clostridia bacterium]